ncbi:MAG: hypothetical protein WBE48_27620, partial [Xanthobacteraceae bacterium]
DRTSLAIVSPKKKFGSNRKKRFCLTEMDFARAATVPAYLRKGLIEAVAAFGRDERMTARQNVTPSRARTLVSTLSKSALSGALPKYRG